MSFFSTLAASESTIGNSSASTGVALLVAAWVAGAKTVILAVPSKVTPSIVRGVASAVAVADNPEHAAAVPAE